MRLGRFAILVGLLASIAAGETRIISSKEVGRLDSNDSHAVVTALIVEDSSQPVKRTRRVRMDFSWADTHSTIYIDQSLLRPEKKIFDDLDRDIGRSTSHGGAGLAFTGSCEFRDHPGVYPLRADYKYAGPQAPALRIFGAAGEQIMFQGLLPRDLSKILGDAIEQLNDGP